MPPFSRAVHYFSRGTTPNIFRQNNTVSTTENCQNNAFRNVIFVKIAQLFEMFSIFVPINQVFMDEKVILQVLAEQREEMSGYDVSGWVSRPEEDFSSGTAIWHRLS